MIEHFFIFIDNDIIFHIINISKKETYCNPLFLSINNSLFKIIFINFQLKN